VRVLHFVVFFYRPNLDFDLDLNLDSNIHSNLNGDNLNPRLGGVPPAPLTRG